MTTPSDIKQSLIYGVSALYASLFAQVLHPFDVIRTRLQSHDGQSKGNLVPKYGGIRGAIRGIYMQEGLKGFTKGIFVSFSANCSSRMIFFAFYEKKKKDLFVRFGQDTKISVTLASLYSSFLTSTLTQPMWVLYTRVQLNTAQKISGFQNLTDNAKNIYSTYGFRGFYRGFWLSLILCAHGIIQINIYEFITLFIKQIRREQGSTGKYYDPFISGVISKAFAIYATYPISTVRTRIQQNQYVDTTLNPKYQNMMDILRKIMRHEGIPGFYKGVSASLFKGLPAKGIYFVFYEQMKNKLSS